MAKCPHRNVILTASWSAVGIVLVAGPFAIRPFLSAQYSHARDLTYAVTALWALGGGVLGGLLNVGRLRMATRNPENRVLRGLVIEPLVGAGVALIAYLALLTRQVSIFPVGALDGDPTFERVLLLGLLSGFLWEPLLTRVQALAAQKKLEELSKCKSIDSDAKPAEGRASTPK